MKVIVIKQVLMRLLGSFNGQRISLKLYGRIRKNEGLIYILKIGYGIKHEPIIGEVRSNNSMSERYDLSAVLKEGDAKFYYRENGKWHEIDKEVVDLNDSFKRTPFPKRLMKVLNKAVVGLFGLGSMGSRITLGLARSSVGNFRLIDPDVFAVENVSRHECDLFDIGRDKVAAVRERILRINPRARVDVFPYDVYKKSEKLQAEIFAGANLIVATTDKKAVQLKVNQDCYRHNVMGLFAGCYDEARAGEVLFVIPGETVICYECLRGGTSQAEKPRHYDYSTTPEDQSYEGEPGLNAAINVISDVAEQYAIGLLLRKEECEMAKLIDPKRNLLFIGGALGQGFYYLKNTSCFKKPFDFVVPVIKEPWHECSTCQADRGKA